MAWRQTVTPVHQLVESFGLLRRNISDGVQLLARDALLYVARNRGDTRACTARNQGASIVDKSLSEHFEFRFFDTPDSGTATRQDDDGIAKNDRSASRCPVAGADLTSRLEPVPKIQKLVYPVQTIESDSPIDKTTDDLVGAVDHP